MDLSKDYPKTSTQISYPNCRARTIMYEKVPLEKMPKIRVDPAFRVSTVYSPQEGLKTIYKESYKMPIQQFGFNAENSKVLKRVREYSKFGSQSMPIRFGLTEYKQEFGIKESSGPSVRGVSVADTTTCPLVLTGRDERDPLPLTDNYGKYLDIYLSTTRGTHRMFTLQEQRGLAAKDIVTSQETMDIPKGRGFGCKFPAFPGQDLDNRDKNMIDKAQFNSEHKLRFIPKGMPIVPNFGCESEMQAAYRRPEGVAIPHLFDRFIEFPQMIIPPSAGQCLCPPGMYTTESYAINKHTSPQTVV